jgi:peptidoglycan-N-acetylglucosamine deacetylase
MIIAGIVLGLLTMSAVLLWCLWWLLRHPRFQFLGDFVSHGPRSSRQIALTFDDGPTTANTVAVLEVLRKHEIKATFFLAGFRMVQNPTLAQQIVRDGHDVGNHSFSHSRMVLKSARFIRDEIQRTDQLIQESGYTKKKIDFRAPYGAKFIGLPRVLSQLGKRHVLWDLEPMDTQTQNADLLVGRTLKKLRPGSIILLHDGGQQKPGTVAAIDQLIPKAKALGYSFVTITDLLSP